MWGLTSPPRPSGRGSHPCTRGRAEPCTLRILADAFTGAHGEKGEKGVRRVGARDCGAQTTGDTPANAPLP